MQRHGCLHVDRYRWQLPVEFGLHSQMEKDKELLPAWTHLTHHLCFEGAQLCTKPKAWQLDLIPTVPPRAAPSKYPWMCECSAQTSDPQHEHTIWSCVLWKLSALRRSAITFISLVHVSLWIYRHRVLFWSTFSLCRQKKILSFCWALQLVLPAEGCPSVQKVKPCSTDSLLYHLLLLATTSMGWFRALGKKQSACRKGQVRCSNDLRSSRAQSSHSQLCEWYMYVTSLSWKEGIKPQAEISKSVWFSLKKIPQGTSYPQILYKHTPYPDTGGEICWPYTVSTGTDTYNRTRLSWLPLCGLKCFLTPPSILILQPPAEAVQMGFAAGQ